MSSQDRVTPERIGEIDDLVIELLDHVDADVPLSGTTLQGVTDAVRELLEEVLRRSDSHFELRQRAERYERAYGRVLRRILSWRELRRQHSTDYLLTSVQRSLVALLEDHPDQVDNEDAEFDAVVY